MYIKKQIKISANKLMEVSAWQDDYAGIQVSSIRFTEFHDDGITPKNIIEFEEHELENYPFVSKFEKMDWQEEIQSKEDEMKLTLHDEIFDGGNLYDVEVHEML